MSIPESVPVRVDFGGGWLDVPRLAQPGGRIVNCAVSPHVSLAKWPYEKNSGIGGSAAYALLQGRNPFESEINAGVGWQDPAIIVETGMCVWRSGSEPILVLKTEPDLLRGIMALYWTGTPHNTPEIAEKHRDYGLIAQAGVMAADGARLENLTLLASAITISYEAQVNEGMDRLPRFGEVAKKYCGSGFGGYGLYVFRRESERNRFVHESSGKALSIEPYMKKIHA